MQSRQIRPGASLEQRFSTLEALRQLLAEPLVEALAPPPGSSRSIPRRSSANVSTLRKSRSSSASPSHVMTPAFGRGA